MIILVTRFDVESHIKGYHAYMTDWTPEISETFKTRSEPEKVVDKFAVAVEKEDQLVRHLNKENSGCFTKTIFLHTNDKNICQVEVREEKGKLRRCTRAASATYSSVLRRRKV